MKQCDRAGPYCKMIGSIMNECSKLHIRVPVISLLCVGPLQNSFQGAIRLQFECPQHLQFEGALDWHVSLFPKVNWFIKSLTIVPKFAKIVFGI